MIEASRVSELLIESFAWFGLTVTPDSGLYQFAALGCLLVLGWLSLLITRGVLNKRVTKLVQLSKNTWDDELHKHHFFTRVGHLVPAVVIYLFSRSLFTEDSDFLQLISKGVIIYVTLTTVSAILALFNTVEDIYNASDFAQRAPITGFVQVGKLLTVIVALLIIVANLLDKSPMLLLSGLGAVTAVLLLIFREAILGFVAGIQIAANRMVNTGDWIEMPSFGADGSVLQVGLTTVKVQNWDNTISTIPTHALITDSVKNWRGMSESSGRRIKRSVHIDQQSIRFCTEDDLMTFSKIRFISEYIAAKKGQLATFHKEQQIDTADLVNSRRLTNIGTFRAYMEAYLRSHGELNKQLTMMVRQLPPSELGLPLEVYCFSAEKDWVKYEGIQADIFDHFLAMMPLFGLRPYQRMSDRQDN